MFISFKFMYLFVVLQRDLDNILIVSYNLSKNKLHTSLTISDYALTIAPFFFLFTKSIQTPTHPTNLVGQSARTHG